MNTLGPNASGPYKQTNPPEFFQPKKNSQVKPISSHPGITWVNLGTMGWVTHTKENLVWNIDGYCYLAAINLKGLRNREWPKYLTLYTMSHFHYKYRKYAGFKVYKSTDSKFHLELDLECKLGEGWTEIDCLAKEGLTHYQRIGGEGLTSKIKEFDGTNYQEWAQKMEAYLKTQELWYYVNGTIEQPMRMERPTDTSAGKESSKVSESAMAAYAEKVKLYEANLAIIMTWDLADDKSLSIIQLKMADKMQYLKKSTASGTWTNIKDQFDKQGLASIFIDFRSAVNFHFKENQEPAVQVAGLNTIIGHLATKGFTLDPKIQAMLILTGLPASWDGIQSTILANQLVDTLTAESVIPILQEEWKR